MSEECGSKECLALANDKRMAILCAKYKFVKPFAYILLAAFLGSAGTGVVAIKMADANDRNHKIDKLAQEKINDKADKRERELLTKVTDIHSALVQAGLIKK